MARVYQFIAQLLIIFKESLFLFFVLVYKSYRYYMITCELTLISSHVLPTFSCHIFPSSLVHLMLSSVYETCEKIQTPHSLVTIVAECVTMMLQPWSARGWCDSGEGECDVERRVGAGRRGLVCDSLGAGPGGTA